MKRFSWMAFVVATLLHIFGTTLLIDAGFTELRALKRAMQMGQPEESFLWLYILSWIWYPIPSFYKIILGHSIPPLFSI